MKINQFIFYICFKIFALQFLDKQITILKIDYPNLKRFTFYKNSNDNIYFFYNDWKNNNVNLLEIDSEKDEVLE